VILTSTEVVLYLGLSTASTDYDKIATFIPVVQDDILQITGSFYNDPYRWVIQDKLEFSSTAKTITVHSESTVDWTQKVQPGNTVYIQNSWWNENSGFKTVSTRTTSVLTVDENLVDEKSTDYAIRTKISRCDFPESVKRIAAKMVWYNVQNADAVNGDLNSESYGGYSVSYKDGSNGYSYGTYPGNLIAGLKKQAGLR